MFILLLIITGIYYWYIYLSIPLEVVKRRNEKKTKWKIMMQLFHNKSDNEPIDNGGY